MVTVARKIQFERHISTANFKSYSHRKLISLKGKFNVFENCFGLKLETVVVLNLTMTA